MELTLVKTMASKSSSVDARRQLLKEAADIVCADRNTAYGEPEDSFEKIAILWSAWIKQPLTASDVAAMMILFKLARLKENPRHRDSILDIAGYAACMESCRHSLTTERQT